MTEKKPSPDWSKDWSLSKEEKEVIENFLNQLLENVWKISYYFFYIIATLFIALDRAVKSSDYHKNFESRVENLDKAKKKFFVIANTVKCKISEILKKWWL